MKYIRSNILRKMFFCLILLFLGLVSATVTHAENYTLIKKWGFYGNDSGQFKYPSGVAVDPSGNVYVADTDNNRIQKFNSSGEFITKWGKSGSRNGSFYYPHGVAADSSGNVYVADTLNNRIQKFSSNGTFLTKWGYRGGGNGGNGLFYFPWSIAVDSLGNVYVADRDNCRIQKFNSSDGINYNFVTKWGYYGNGEGNLSYPSGVAVDTSGNVYVADSVNNRIQKFNSSDGINYNFVIKWGSSGSSEGNFSYPCGVVVDSSGNVYVADEYNNRTQKFSSSGAFITQLGSSGSDDGQFNKPNAVAVDSSGNVYVADSGNNRIQKFALEKIIPTITWNNPADIVYRTPLNDTQLNATASVPGTFNYTPSSGTILDVGTQTLHADFTPIDATNYTKASKNVTMNVLENDNIKISKVVGAYYKCDSWSNKRYPLINLSGKNYVPLFDDNEPIWKCHVDKLAKLVLDNNSEYTLKTGEKLDLGSGYALEAKQVDVDGKKVWLEFSKGGQYIDDAIVSTDTGDKTWTCRLNNIQNVTNVPVLKVHVDQVFQGAVDSIAQIDGIWLIDFENATTHHVGDEFGNYTLIQINYGVNESDPGSLVFELTGTSSTTCNVVGVHYKCNRWSDKQYPLINLSGENYVPLFDDNEPIWKCHVDKLAKRVIDSGDMYTLKTGEKLDFCSGYALETKQVDVDGKKIWLEFSKNGQYIDDAIVSTDTGDKTWTCRLDNVQGENSIPVLKVHVNQVFQGAVDGVAQIDGIWLIDYANATTLKAGDQFENLTLTQINYGVNESDSGSLVFENTTSLP